MICLGYTVLTTSPLVKCNSIVSSAFWKVWLRNEDLQLWCWRASSGDEGLAAEARRPESEPQNSHEKGRALLCVCSPSAEMEEARGSLECTGQWQSWVSQPQVKKRHCLKTKASNKQNQCGSFLRNNRGWSLTSIFMNTCMHSLTCALLSLSSSLNFNPLGQHRHRGLLGPFLRLQGTPQTWNETDVWFWSCLGDTVMEVMEEGNKVTFTRLPEPCSFAGGGCAMWGCTQSLNIPTSKCRQEQIFQNLGLEPLGELLPSHQASRWCWLLVTWERNQILLYSSHFHVSRKAKSLQMTKPQSPLNKYVTLPLVKNGALVFPGQAGPLASW